MDDQIRHYKAKLQYEIDPWDLNEALGRGDKILLVDTRSPEAYGRSHIPGAINIPHRMMSPATTAHLDKTALIVTYCDGIRCNGSTKGALNMLQLGFRVKELIGGLDCWRHTAIRFTDRMRHNLLARAVAHSPRALRFLTRRAYTQASRKRGLRQFMKSKWEQSSDILSFWKLTETAEVVWGESS